MLRILLVSAIGVLPAARAWAVDVMSSRSDHMRVVFLRPNEVLRMGGALGPLQANGTKVDLTYSVGGFMAGGFEAIAPGAPAAK